jgi:hypothetical protein
MVIMLLKAERGLSHFKSSVRCLDNVHFHWNHKKTKTLHTTQTDVSCFSYSEYLYEVPLNKRGTNQLTYECTDLTNISTDWMAQDCLKKAIINESSTKKPPVTLKVHYSIHKIQPMKMRPSRVGELSPDFHNVFLQD